MNIVSTDEFLRRGHQVDFDMMNLDSVVQGIVANAPDSVPSADLMTWNGLKSAWNTYYQNNVANVPVLPWSDASDLDTWLSRIQTWKAKSAGWAKASGNNNAQGIVAAMPESPASIAHLEDPPAGTPTWVWLLLGTAFATGIGYSISSAAKLAAATRGVR